MTERPTPPVTLVPMGPEAWASWRERSIREYAESKVRAGTWPEGQALDLAAAEFAELLPAGRSTPRHELRSVVTHEGAVVGSVWLGPSRADGTAPCYVWDIQVEPDLRGQGYGRAAMLAAEALAGSLGCDRLELHVFGDNATARALYRSLGFVETDVSMRKDLGERVREWDASAAG